MITRGLESAANGMIALMNQNDSTANNIANVNTTGYKKQVLTFKNIYDAAIVHKEQFDRDSARYIGDLSTGSEVMKLTYDFSQGPFTQTNNVFDVAIQGDGFFKIEDATDGSISYTRNGAFTLNNRGFLVTKDGDYVMDKRSRRIKVNTNDVVIRSMKNITINEEGTIQVITNNTDVIAQQQLGVFDFSNKEDLRNIGGSKFVPMTGNLNPELVAKKYTIAQGALEMSNTTLVNEMIRTINTTRNYEALSKVVKQSSNTLSEAMRVARL